MTIEKNLVSIITPCYNGEKYISRFLESVLIQNYRPIELILVNDGSTDKTEQIIMNYHSLFEKKGIKFIYVYQENGGQARAINTGLEMCHGEYITWPDSDDILEKDNIEKKVDFLSNNPIYCMVMCKTKCVKEGNLNKTIFVLERKKPYEGNLFEDFLFVNNVYFAPGSFMVKSKDLYHALNGNKLIENKAGQNWQTLLPLSYYFKCRFIHDILYTYVIRENSHSRQEKTISKILDKYNNHIDLLEQILKVLIKDKDELNYYLEKMNDVYLKRRLDVYFEFNYRKEFNDEFLNNIVTSFSRRYLFYFFIINMHLNKLYKKIRRKKDVFS